MVDMDLDDLDGPTQAPKRTTRFAPKNSKFNPKPKTEPVLSEPVPPNSEKFDSISLIKKEELDSKPSLVDSTTAKADYEAFPPSSSSSAANGVVEMDVEAKTEGEEQPINNDPMEVESGEDEVVREIDVYFTPSTDPNSQLYVLQYPLRPMWRPYELDERCEEVRVKPESAEVEVDLEVDVDSKNYDPDADRKLRMTKQTLSSSWKPPRTTGRYAVGVLVGNKLHLNPIHAVVQLRPSMRHLKSWSSNNKHNVTSNAEDTIELEKLTEEKPLGPSNKQKKQLGVSSEQKQQLGVLSEQSKDIGESWVPLKYFGSKSDVSARYLENMVAHEGSPMQFLMNPYDYVNSLCPSSSNENNKTKGPSRRFLLSLPLEDRYKTWLLEGPPVHRFDALKHLAPSDSIEDVLGVLQKLAQLVQGLWVPKSSVLHGRDGGVEALARDYILLLFSKNPVINNAQLPSQPQLGKAMKGILNVLAVERPAFNDWKFKEPQDMSFIKLYPNIVKEQEQAWERLEKAITDHVFGGRSRPGMKNSLKPNSDDRPVTLKNSNKVASRKLNGAPSRMPMTDEAREALPKALQKLLQTYKVCSFQQICQRLREMAVSESARPKGVAREAIAAANGVDAPPEELLTIISQVAINIHDVFVLKSSLDHPQYDELRKVVIDLFIAEGRNAKLKKAAIVEAAKMRLSREITPNEYQKVLSELCVSQGSAWVLKSGDGNPK